MTFEEIQAMPVGPIMDQAVGERVMGSDQLGLHGWSTEIERVPELVHRMEQLGYVVNIRRSTWDVAEYMPRHTDLGKLVWIASFRSCPPRLHSDLCEGFAYAVLLPPAVCRAALQALLTDGRW